MRWLILWMLLGVTLPAAAAPMNSPAAGVIEGLLRLDAGYDFAYRSMEATVEGEDDAEDDTVTLRSAGLSVALTFEPVKYVALDARVTLWRPKVDEVNGTFPWGWGAGGTLRITPLHLAEDLVHIGLYGAFDGKLVGWPSAENGPVRLFCLRAGLGVGLGSASRGWYVEAGGHYSRGWGRLVFDVSTIDADTQEVSITGYRYSLAQPLPVGVRLGAGLISGPIAPADSTRARVQAGLEVTLLDEYALAITIGVIL